MKLTSLKLAVPAMLLFVAGASFADPATSPGAKASSAVTTATAENILGHKVQEKLKADKRLEGADIEADVTDQGSVLLRGTTRNMEQSQIAEELAMSVAGVSKIKNELQIPGDK